MQLGMLTVAFCRHFLEAIRSNIADQRRSRGDATALVDYQVTLPAIHIAPSASSSLSHSIAVTLLQAFEDEEVDNVVASPGQLPRSKNTASKA